MGVEKRLPDAGRLDEASRTQLRASVPPLKNVGKLHVFDIASAFFDALYGIARFGKAARSGVTHTSEGRSWESLKSAGILQESTKRMGIL